MQLQTSRFLRSVNQGTGDLNLMGLKPGEFLTLNVIVTHSVKSNVLVRTRKNVRLRDGHKGFTISVLLYICIVIHFHIQVDGSSHVIEKMYRLPPAC